MVRFIRFMSARMPEQKEGAGVVENDEILGAYQTGGIA